MNTPISSPEIGKNILVNGINVNYHDQDEKHISSETLSVLQEAANPSREDSSGGNSENSSETKDSMLDNDSYASSVNSESNSTTYAQSPEGEILFRESSMNSSEFRFTGKNVPLGTTTMQRNEYMNEKQKVSFGQMNQKMGIRP